MKFLHLADCHLDAPLVDLGQTANKANARRQELKATFSKAMEIAKVENVDAIFICGDLFEHKYVTKATIKFLNEKFLEIPKIKVFISPGNHDPLISNSYYSTHSWPDNVHIFKGKFEKVSIPTLNANIWGVGFEDFYVSKCLVKDIGNEHSDVVNILVTHGNIDSQGGDDKYHPMPLRYISSIGFDYCALGHIHKKNEYEKDGIYYCGSLEPLGFDELGDHGLIIGEVTKEFKRVKFYPIAQRKYVNQEIDITGVTNLEEIINKIRILIPVDSARNDLYKVLLVGQADEDLFLDLELIQERLNNTFYFITIESKTKLSYPIEEFQKEYTLKGIYTKKIIDMIEKAEPNDRIKLERALHFGLDALIKGEVDLK